MLVIAAHIDPDINDFHPKSWFLAANLSKAHFTLW